MRLSYTLLYLWDRGLVDDAVSTYFHLDKETTPQMEAGKKLHEEIAEHVTMYNTFPDWFANHELKMPETEKEVIVEYNEMFDLKCYMDLYDSVTNTLFEYKSGVSDSLSWARTWQIPIYFLIAELANIKVDSAYLIHHDQYKKETDWCVVHNNKTKRDMARNIIDSLGPDIYYYFEKEGLL